MFFPLKQNRIIVSPSKFNQNPYQTVRGYEKPDESDWLLVYIIDSKGNIFSSPVVNQSFCVDLAKKISLPD